MARSLEKLKKQYTSVAPDKKGGMMGGHGPGGPGRRMGPRPQGKPKSTKPTVSRLLKYVGRYKWRLLMVIFCMLFGSVTALCGSYFLAPIIDRITLTVNPDANIKMTYLERAADGVIEWVTETELFSSLMGSKAAEITVYITAALIILSAIYLIEILSNYLQNRIMVSVSQNSIERIRNDLFESMEALPLGYFDRTPTGETMSRFTNDIDNIDMMLNNTIINMISGVITLVGTFVMMVSTNIWLTLITVCFVPLFIRLGGFVGKRASKYYVGQQAALGAINGYIEESVTGQKVIKVFNHEDVSVEEFSLLNADMREKQFRAQFYGGIMGPILGNTSQINYSVTAGVGGLLCLAGHFDPGGLAVFVNYSRQFSRPIDMISM
ncbi:MAG: ABC transporter ATP-binding protein, partial [Clostridia bacterium]|nr:ABC transporter ATP-binding protein [Clostridia bacterium]